ncbi:MAG: 2,3-bisphosphoglycerate-independent phosphoglycerate mutase, partial [Oscillospiraceae bacterium]|nr:2,3-bisphosphoglycerate-independent phosphoglycerate mutase [Oscillospiraceae bacterium]
MAGKWGIKLKTKTVVLVIMDGVGIGTGGEGDAVKRAYTPMLDMLIASCPHTALKAHGTAVGLPSDDDMGNSEVGHNALGCGQIYSQGAKLVNESIENSAIFHSETWKELISGCAENESKLHFIGLLSDGNVHSNIEHLKSMLEKAKQDGVKNARVHILLDGRDVPATSALLYVDELETCLSNLNDAGFNAKIASGGGRMKITMDRYQADWDMVKTRWETHVCGIGRQFPTARE